MACIECGMFVSPPPFTCDSRSINAIFFHPSHSSNCICMTTCQQSHHAALQLASITIIVCLIWPVAWRVRVYIYICVCVCVRVRVCVRYRSHPYSFSTCIMWNVYTRTVGMHNTTDDEWLRHVRAEERSWLGFSPSTDDTYVWHMVDVWLTYT